MRFHGFDWDAGNRAKCQKHGLSLAEIEAIFQRGPRIAPDDRHSAGEERFIAVGVHASGRPVFVAFTIRLRAGLPHLRPISARFMHVKEAIRYERKNEA
jgi:hypothetical protein